MVGPGKRVTRRCNVITQPNPVKPIICCRQLHPREPGPSAIEENGVEPGVRWRAAVRKITRGLGVSRPDWKSDSCAANLLVRYIFSITSLACISITTMALNFRRSRWLSSPLIASEYLLSDWFCRFRSFFSGLLDSINL